MIILKTERLILRNVELKDAVEMKDYRNNAICSKYQRGQTKDMDGIKALIKKYQFETLSADKSFIMTVALKATDEMIGEIVVLPNKGTFSLGYTISYKHHRMGYAFESLSALTDYLHCLYPLMGFICFTEIENYPSRLLLQKLGYRDLGYIESKESEVFGKWLTESTEKEIRLAVNH
ncbi:GNAT family N-acetyltransferase [Levyella massiliensis]|uniref:GNAT family N-acetyltransferase n=1 Tax=Levyella massiliensis TaxID=938289 RepID=UPI003EBB39A6